MAKLFGDTDIAVYQEDIHVDHNTHELVVEQHDGSHVTRVATEGALPAGTPKIRRSVEHEHDEKIVAQETETRVLGDEKVAAKA